MVSAGGKFNHPKYKADTDKASNKDPKHPVYVLSLWLMTSLIVLSKNIKSQKQKSR
jgi:hypothetical protein